MLADPGPDAHPTELAQDLVRFLTARLAPLEAAVLLEEADGSLALAAWSSEQVRVLAMFELDAQEGPCVDCWRSGKPCADVRAVPTATAVADQADAWPRYSLMAGALGIARVHAIPLAVGEWRLGVLCLAGRVDEALPPAQRELATALTTATTSGLVHQRVVQDLATLTGQLHHALGSRVLIEQSKGMVAERLGVSTSDAFDLLRRFARRHGLPLRAVAAAAMDGEIGAEELLPREAPHFIQP